jgi:hypothetical protein
MLDLSQSLARLDERTRQALSRCSHDLEVIKSQGMVSQREENITNMPITDLGSKFTNQEKKS